jgi:hypothetical protein
MQFQAIGVLSGQVSFNPQAQATIALSGKQYRLFVPKTMQKKLKSDPSWP